MQDTQIVKKEDVKDLVGNTNTGLSNVVGNIKEEENIKREPKPIPSLNIMKKRLISYFENKKNQIVKSFSSLMGNPFKLNEAVNQVREENAMISKFIHKDGEEVKQTYFKYFGHLHGIQNSEKKS